MLLLPKGENKSIFRVYIFSESIVSLYQELDGWEPEDDPWKEHAKHARGNCAYVNLGKKPAELTVEDVLSLEADRARCLVEKMHEKWAKLFEEKMQETRREIDALAPKSKPEKRKTKTK